MTPAEQVAAWVEALDDALIVYTGRTGHTATLRSLRDRLMRGHVEEREHDAEGEVITEAWAGQLRKSGHPVVTVLVLLLG